MDSGLWGGWVDFLFLFPWPFSLPLSLSRVEMPDAWSQLGVGSIASLSFFWNFSTSTRSRFRALLFCPGAAAFVTVYVGVS